MRSLYPHLRFAGFGPTRFDPSPPEPTRVIGKTVRLLREKVREHCEQIPGVYGMVDSHGRLIYVGKAKRLRARLMSYFRKHSRDAKAGRIITRARLILWEPAVSEFVALLRELELIHRFRPVYNVQGQPGSRKVCYLILGRRPAPFLFASRNPPKDAIATFGPLPSLHRATDAIRRLNDFFRLRDCDRNTVMHFADQRDLFPVERPAGCLRYEIGTCSGPCVAGTSRAGYSRQARAAREFLEGRDDAIIRRMQGEMQQAAAEQAYERAAALRDRIQPVQWLADRLAWLQKARREYTFVYPHAGHGDQTVWLLIHRGRVLRGLAVPKDAQSRKAASKILDSTFAMAEKSPVEADQMDSILLVASWFRRNPEERGKVLSLEEAMRSLQRKTPD